MDHKTKEHIEIVRDICEIARDYEVGLLGRLFYTSRERRYDTVQALRLYKHALRNIPPELPDKGLDSLKIRITKRINALEKSLKPNRK
ncbi:MAG: hypothetical protein KJ718_02235 [Nanoarchaeota archaeon]|nr:hypothetical protein [Nanoarchaeota archaeon]